MAPILFSLCPNWKFASNHTADPDGRIILIWRDSINVQILSESRQCITCKINFPNHQPILYSAIYASNLSSERVELWTELIHLQTSLGLDNTNWILGGDLNQIIHPMEHSEPSITAPDFLMYQLRDCFTQLGLFDLRYIGPTLTWINSRPENPISKKLDRLMVNNSLVSSFPDVLASFLPPNFSDHSPCVIDLAFNLPLAGTQPYKFQNYLIKHPGFAQLLQDAWIQAGNVSQTLTQLCWKLKQIKSDLKLLNKENYSKIQERASETNGLLQIAQVQALQDPCPITFQAEKDLHQKWNFLREIEEMFFRQKSRINWLREGDLNTTFFHRICQTRASYNAIRVFLSDTGAWITDPQEMMVLAVNHFSSILGYQPPLLLYTPPVWFQDLTSFTFPLHLNQLMCSIPSDEEIKSTIFKLNPNKAPGPDGLTSAFFKASWETIGLEVVAAIKNFFASNFLPAMTNATILSLVPKFPGASKVTDYRPISCLNTIYKVISRLLVKKLKPMLSTLILPSQTAFVKGRLLIENTTLAGELVNVYHKNKGPKKITIKVDITKAFDTLSWEFLFSCLEGLHLPQRFIRQIKACICTSSYMVGYNGSVHGFFKGKRGLRQGDPLSPYLFVIAMNCLSHMLNKAARQNRFNYHTSCASTKLTHLSFADDLLIFIDGSIDFVQQVLQVLKEFENRSGLAVSMQKTSFYASGLTPSETDLIQASTGMALGSLPFRYLGVPLNSRKLSLTNCEPLIHQIKTRFSSWSVKSLSFSGRLLLIKTVIAGVTTFWCSAYVLPKACVDRINSLCSMFPWKGNIEGLNSARVSWETVVLTKRQGGLGVKDLYTWNKACTLRLLWLLFFRPDSVWVQWFKEVILKGSVHNYWTTTPKQSYSWLVNKLLKLKQVVFPLIKLRLQNGETARFWSDNWTPFDDLHTHLSGTNSRLGIPLHATVASLYGNGTWSLPPARSEAQIELYVYLTTVELNSSQDYYEWEINGQVQTTYRTGPL